MAINKMDTVGYREDRFRAVSLELSAYLAKDRHRAAVVVPIAAREGENLVKQSAKMAWYNGPTLLAALDGLMPAQPAGRRCRCAYRCRTSIASTRAASSPAASNPAG